ncbi:MAG: hypothetical protein CM1200mP2_18160 [Planctomycetaceae bacterium]|nr:MAG: hypothetical protein CM1200mP2_18160 [Planctomycetaceae bacterium]
MSMLADDHPVVGSGTPPHTAPRARRVIHIVATGGFSQVDSFDYKPQLARLHGTPLKSDEKPDVFFGKVGLLRQSDWPFRQRGNSGLWVSELFPPSCRSGRRTDGHQVDGRRDLQPHAGNVPGKQRLSAQRVSRPGFLALLRPGQRLSQPTHPRGDSGSPWIAGRGLHQLDQRFSSLRAPGRSTESSRNAIGRPFPSRPLPAATERDSRNSWPLNRQHLEQRVRDALLGRIRSYQLAARMQWLSRRSQLSIPKPQKPRNNSRPRREPTADFGRACLRARRLLQQGVRFVQLFRAALSVAPTQLGWTRGHGQESRREAARVDQPLAALLTDLRAQAAR